MHWISGHTAPTEKKGKNTCPMNAWIYVWSIRKGLLETATSPVAKVDMGSNFHKLF